MKNLEGINKHFDGLSIYGKYKQKMVQNIRSAKRRGDISVQSRTVKQKLERIREIDRSAQ